MRHSSAALAGLLLAVAVAGLPLPRPLPVDSMGFPCVPESTDPKCNPLTEED